MLAEMPVSEFDRWHDHLVGRPWWKVPERYYGNQLLALLVNLHSKQPISPDEVDIYFTPKPVPEAAWQSIKAKMGGMVGVNRKDGNS